MTSDPCGDLVSSVVAIDKPIGLTSHDVVSRVRRATGVKRVGHAGTLDPMATGLLLVLIGPAARLGRYLMGHDKEYDAVVTFGTETDTDDSDGVAVRSAEPPAWVCDRERAAEAVEALRGTHSQVPPVYSAIKVAGRKSYEAARKGESVDLAPREIEVSEAELIDVLPHGPAWRVRLRVSKGTYVRAIARDLGRELGSAAHLSALRRTASGALDVDSAHTLESFEESVSEGRCGGLVADVRMLLGMPVVEVDEESAARVSDGKTLSVAAWAGCATFDGALAAIFAQGRLLAVYRRKGDILAPETVFAVPVAGPCREDAAGGAR